MQESERQTDELGSLIAEFSPGRFNRYAGILVTIIVMGVGAFLVGLPLYSAHAAGWELPFDVERGWSWLAVGMMTLLGLGIVGLGVVLAMYVNRLGSRSVAIHEGGLLVLDQRSAREIPWSAIVYIHETRLYQRLPLLKGLSGQLLPKLQSTYYEVTTTQGEEIRFDGDSVCKVRRFGSLLAKHALPHSVPWEHYDKVEDADPVHRPSVAEITLATTEDSLEKSDRQSTARFLLRVIAGFVVLGVITALVAIGKQAIENLQQTEKKNERINKLLQEAIERNAQDGGDNSGGEALRRLVGIKKPASKKPTNDNPK